MRVLMVSAELFPWAKVGGLGDMVAALSGALRRRGHDIRCALPRYPSVERTLDGRSRTLGESEVTLSIQDGSARVRLLLVQPDESVAPLLLVDHDVFRREGIYSDERTGEGYPDNGFRWAIFCRAVHAALRADDWTPDVVHAHDHQAAPLLGLIRWSAGGPQAPKVLTLHNVGYQGIESPSWIADSGLPWELYRPLGPLEFHGNVNLMKIGVEAADMLTTVSPRYAEEIRSSEEFGHGLTGVLDARRSRLVGILNGIDTRVWDPQTDPHLPHHYTAERLANKSRIRTALRRELGLTVPAALTPLAAFVGRLTPQKGLDILLPALDELLGQRLQAVVLGSGDKPIEQALGRMAARHRGRLGVRIGFDEALAHRIEAGADMFLMPSLYEPCGLNQMYSLRYGTVPVVRHVGGLADTVVDLDEDPPRANGFAFRLYDTRELAKTVNRACRAWRNRKLWRELMHRGMTADLSWERAAGQYEQVYRRAAAASRES